MQLYRRILNKFPNDFSNKTVPFFCFKHSCTHARNSYNHSQHDSWFPLCHSGNIIIILLRSDYSIPELVTFNEWINTSIVDVHGVLLVGHLMNILWKPTRIFNSMLKWLFGPVIFQVSNSKKNRKKPHLSAKWALILFLLFFFYWILNLNSRGKKYIPSNVLLRISWRICQCVLWWR